MDNDYKDLGSIRHKEFNEFIKEKDFKGRNNYKLKDLKAKFGFKPMITGVLGQNPPRQNPPDKIPLDKIPPRTKSPRLNPPGQNPLITFYIQNPFPSNSKHFLSESGLRSV